MTIFQAFKNGVQQTWRFQKMIWILYGMTFLLAAFVAMPFKSYLESKVGHSLVVGDMVKGFDYTVINDFLNAYGDGINPIVNQSFLALGLFLLLFIFLMGGIISVFQQKDWSVFWQNSGAYFWRMLRLTLYFLAVHTIILIVFVQIYIGMAKGFTFSKLTSDRVIFDGLYIFVACVPILAFFAMWRDYAKIILVKRNSLEFKPITTAFRFVIKNFRKAYGLYLFVWLIFGILFLVNYWITTSFAVNSTGTIWISFLLSQIFVIIRLGLKLVNLSSATLLYESVSLNNP